MKKLIIFIVMIFFVLVSCGGILSIDKDIFNVEIFLKIKLIVFYEIDILVKIGVLELFFKMLKNGKVKFLLVKNYY